MSGVVVVGASVGGVRVVQGLRAGGYAGPVSIVDPDAEEPYDKPPLSKEVLADPSTAPPALVDGGLRTLGVRLHLGTAAVELDLERRSVSLDTGTRLDYDHLVVATGSVPRTLPGVPQPLVHYLRTHADARRLRTALHGARRIVVVGGGFIGTEVASTARARGIEVLLVEAGSRLAARAMSVAASEHLAKLHRASGTELALGRRMVDVTVHGDGRRVILDDGREVTCDVVVVGIGTQPATAWLGASGLDLDDGVLCSEAMLASSEGCAWAIGDVARWHNPLYGRRMRMEHWTSAREQATVVAANIVHGSPLRAARLVPYVWSDQLGLRVQQVGDDDLAAADVESETAGPGGRGRIFRYLRRGQVVGATGFDAQREMALVRRDLQLANRDRAPLS